MHHNITYCDQGEVYKQKCLNPLSTIYEGILYVEDWVDIDGISGKYQVSSFGRIKRLNQVVKRNSIKGDLRYSEKIIAPRFNKKGYIGAHFKTTTGYMSVRINRLVATYFIKNEDNKPEVNHIDANKSNNFYMNLEWNTRVENMTHAAENNLIKGMLGSENHKSILILDTHTGIFYESMRQAAFAKGLKYKNVARYLDGTFKKNKTGLIYA